MSDTDEASEEVERVKEEGSGVAEWATILSEGVSNIVLCRCGLVQGMHHMYRLISMSELACCCLL